MNGHKSSFRWLICADSWLVISTLHCHRADTSIIGVVVSLPFPLTSLQHIALILIKILIDVIATAAQIRNCSKGTHISQVDIIAAIWLRVAGEAVNDATTCGHILLTQDVVVDVTYLGVFLNLQLLHYLP